MPDGANIVTVSSGLGKNARAGYKAYTASKEAARFAAASARRRGVRAGCDELDPFLGFALVLSNIWLSR